MQTKLELLGCPQESPNVSNSMQTEDNLTVLLKHCEHSCEKFEWVSTGLEREIGW